MEKNWVLRAFLSSEMTIPYIGTATVSEAMWAILPGIAACLAILYPFYLSGGEFIFLDWIGTASSLHPYIHFMDVYGQDGLGFRAIPFLIAQLPFVLLFGQGASAAFSKLFFLFIFSIGSVGIYLHMRKLPKGTYLLGVAILSFSPFVYERIMLGQFPMVLSLASLPLVLYLAKRFVESHSLKAAILSVLALSLLNLQHHGLIISGTIIAAYFAANAFFSKDRPGLMKAYALYALIFIAINLYWIVPYLALSKPTILSAINTQHLEFFKPPASSSINNLARAAEMYGAWREEGIKIAYKSAPLPTISGGLWLMFSGMIIALLVFLSLYCIIQKPNEPLSIAMALSWIAGIAIAPGLSHPWTAPLFSWLFSSVPMFAGFRDSNKWVESIVIAYAILAPVGLALLLKTQKQTVRNVAFALVIAAVLLANYTVFGLSDQIRPIEYPHEYLNMTNYAAESGITVYLPWSIYNTYNWSAPIGSDGRVIAPPVKFAYPIIKIGVSPSDIGEDLPPVKRLGGCINAQNISCMAEFNVSRVIVDECAMGKGLYLWFTANRTALKREGCLAIYDTR